MRLGWAAELSWDHSHCLYPAKRPQVKKAGRVANRESGVCIAGSLLTTVCRKESIA